jgi:hypothetical protein
MAESLQCTGSFPHDGLYYIKKIVLQGGWTLGFLSLPMVSYLLPNTMHFELFIALSSILLLPIYFVLPESPRWLYTVGRTQEAANVMERILKFNGKDMTKSEILAHWAKIELRVKPVSSSSNFMVFLKINYFFKVAVMSDSYSFFRLGSKFE